MERRAAHGVIYDLGANNGDDLAYYLKKGRTVVGVEANPVLAAACAARFAADIAERRLVLINAAVSTSDATGDIDFYVHKSVDVLSTLKEPPAASAADYERIRVPHIKASTLIRENGFPHYIKIDLEGYDDEVLAHLFKSGIHPDYISAESHSIRTFCLLVAAGYQAFNLVDGSMVPHKYKNATIATVQGAEPHSFPFHSAGPFAEDIRSPWLDENGFFELLAREGLGWKDIHATNQIRPHTPPPRPTPGSWSIRPRLNDRLRGLIRRIETVG